MFRNRWSCTRLLDEHVSTRTHVHSASNYRFFPSSLVAHAVRGQPPQKGIILHFSYADGARKRTALRTVLVDSGRCPSEGYFCVASDGARLDESVSQVQAEIRHLSMGDERNQEMKSCATVPITSGGSFQVGVRFGYGRSAPEVQDLQLGVKKSLSTGSSTQDVRVANNFVSIACTKCRGQEA